MTNTPTVMSTRALNRALLARQGLLVSWTCSTETAIERLVGVQAQAPHPPYLGLWTRLADFDPNSLSRLLIDRRAVRATLMRGTIHLATADDVLALWPVVRKAAERTFLGSTARRNAVADLDIAGILDAGRALIEDHPRTAAELRTLLSARWPGRDPHFLAQTVLFLLPVLQVPPRGVWGASGPIAWTTTDGWLGHSFGTDEAPDMVILRYLAAFGPATITDAQTWSGLTRLRAAFDRLRPALQTFHDERGRELFDLPDAPRPDPATSVPIRFLPAFDNLILAHDDRSRVIPAAFRRRLASQNGMVPATVLVDGFVAGTWTISGGRDGKILVITPFAPFTGAEQSALAEEGERLIGFLFGGVGVGTQSIQVATLKG